MLTSELIKVLMEYAEGQGFQDSDGALTTGRKEDDRASNSNQLSVPIYQINIYRLSRNAPTTAQPTPWVIW